MMLTPRDFLPLARYRQLRPQVRRAMVVHRNRFTLDLGPCMRVQVEDLRSAWYQVQEALHRQSIEDPAGIWEVLDTHAHLMPEPGECKMTVFVAANATGQAGRGPALLDAAVQQIELSVSGRCSPATSRGDENTQDHNPLLPSGVYFLRFALSPVAHDFNPQQAGALALRCRHWAYRYQASLPMPLGLVQAATMAA